MEIPLKNLPICQLYLPSPLFRVLYKHPFIILPVVLKKVEISKIETTLKPNRVVIVNFSESMKFILTPISLISEFSSFIEKFAPTIHFIVFPLTFVVTSVLVEEFTMAISLSIEFVALVPGASLILLNNVLMIWEINGVLSISDSWWRILRVLISDFNNGAVVLVLLDRADGSSLSIGNVIFIIVIFLLFPFTHFVLYYLFMGIGVQGDIIDTLVNENIWLWIKINFFLILNDSSLFLNLWDFLFWVSFVVSIKKRTNTQTFEYLFDLLVGPVKRNLRICLKSLISDCILPHCESR